METRHERILDLLVCYQEAEVHGQPVTVEELCADCPELIDEVRRQVELHCRLGRFARCDESEFTTRGPDDDEPDYTTVAPDTNAGASSSIEDSRATKSPEDEDSFATVPPCGGETDASTRRDVIPGYELLAELGRGGMGVVYKARQSGLNRLVALKMILSADAAGEAMVARFRTEAEAIARLNHPNIVQVFDVGEHDGRPFFSLELCGGGSLDRKLRGKPIDPKEAATLLAALSGAMEAAHRANVVHRDLKPANVLLADDGTPKITDFGLARKLDELRQTQHGAVMGSPPYMPPEQARGETASLGPSVDVYALGATLYECLTGRPPFLGATVYDTIHQVINDETVPPSRLNPRVPRDLETVCLKALHKRPEGRYATAGELADDLGRWLRGEPVRARPTTPWERAWKWARRRPALAALYAALLAAALGVVAGGVAFGLYQRELRGQAELRAGRWRNIYDLVAQGKQAEADGRLALQEQHHERARAHFERASEALTGALAALDQESEADASLRDEASELLEGVKRYLRDQEERGRRLEHVRAFAQERDEVTFRDVSPTARDEPGNRERIIRLASAALARFGVTPERPPAEAGRALLDGPPFESPRQREQVAEGCYEVLLAWAEAASSPDGPGQPADERARQALRLLEIAAALGEAHGMPSPRTFHLRRARCREQAGDLGGAAADRAVAATLPPRTPRDHFLAGLEAWKQGRLDEARAACDEALRLRPDHFWAQYVLATCHLQAAEWRLARGELTACLGRRPDFLWARLLRGTAHAELNELGRAEEDFAAVLGKADDPLTRYVALCNRSALRLRQKRPDDALRDLSDAVAQAKRAGLPPYQAHWNAATVHQERKDWGAAAEALGRALESRQDAALYSARAWAHDKRGDAESARKDFAKVVELEPKGGRSDRVLGALVELAHLEHAAGKHPEALSHADDALRRNPGWAAAHRQRAVTLLALGRHAEAGAALDRYLAVGGRRRAAIYLARGLISANKTDWAAAIEAYGIALGLEQVASTPAEAEELRQVRLQARGERGWAYLQMDAPKLALLDFDAAIGKGPGGYRFLCGRALALVRLRRVEEGLRDAEAALKAEDAMGAEAPLLAACAYGRAAALAAVTAEKDKVERTKASREERAGRLLAEALRRVPAQERAAFWRARVQKEETLAEARRQAGVRELARDFGR